MKEFARKHDLEFKLKKNRIPIDLRTPAWSQRTPSGVEEDIVYGDIFDMDDRDEEYLYPEGAKESAFPRPAY